MIGMPPRRLTRFRIAAGAALLAASVGLIALGFYRLEERATEKEATAVLAGVADLKVRQLAIWRSQRIADANSINRNAMTQKGLERALNGLATSDELAAVKDWMEASCWEFSYAGALLSDPSGRVILTAGRRPWSQTDVNQLVGREYSFTTTILDEFRAGGREDPVYLSVILPLRHSQNERAFGVLLLEVDPSKYLYPLLQAWPTPSSSGETMLARHDGSDVLYLNELRHRAHSALKLRIPMDHDAVLAVRAVDDQQIDREALDYRGVPVLAVWRAVPGTAWYLIAKVDRAEVFAPHRMRSLGTSGGLAALVAAVLLGIFVLRRNRALSHYKELHEAQLEKLAARGQYDYLSRYANDMILLFDKSGQIVEANDRAVQAYGYSREELLAMTIRNLRDPGSMDSLDSLWKLLEQQDSSIVETLHLCRDGRKLPVEVSSRLINVEGKQLRQSIIRDISDRKALERELRTMLGRLSAVIAASPAAIIVLSPNSRVTGWNKAAEATFGWTEQETLGKPLPIIPAELLPQARELRERVARGETIPGREYVLRTKAGGRVDVSFFAAAFRDEAGRPLGYVGVLLDITPQKRAARTLAESESRFRALFEQAAVGVAMLSLEGQVLSVNRRFGAVMGCLPEQLLSRSIFDVIPSAGPESEQVLIEQWLRGGPEAHPSERSFVRGDNSSGWVELTISVMREPSGGPQGFIAVIQDVTDRKLAQEASKQDSGRLRQVVDHAPQGILVHMGDRICLTNPAAVLLLGATSAADLLDTPLLDRVHPEERQDFMIRSASLLADSTSAPAVERRYLRMDGTILYTEASATPIDFDNQPAALVYFRDISERRRADAEKARLEEQLLQAQKLESIGLLAGGVAHDFNNHLTVINGYCDLLRIRLKPQDPSWQAIGEIRRAGERAAAMTRQLLAFSRKQVIEARPIRLCDVVEDSRGLLLPLLSEGIELVVAHHGNPSTVVADPGQLSQVLMNLAVNARDAMPQGGRMMIETSNVDINPSCALRHPEVTPGSYALLSVSDTGIGMSEETQRRIFEPFFTTKEKGKGTGLGLSMVYGIVRQMGGWVWVYSEPGQGATFKIYFPRVERSAEPVAKADPVEHHCAGSETLLVVEDQPELLTLAVTVLSGCGYTILAACSGADALSKASSHLGSIDLMLTDVVMPGMSGRELAIRMELVRPQMKIIYTSGYPADVIALQGVLEPDLDYLAKPFTPMQLIARVRSALG